MHTLMQAFIGHTHVATLCHLSQLRQHRCLNRPAQLPRSTGKTSTPRIVSSATMSWLQVRRDHAHVAGSRFLMRCVAGGHLLHRQERSRTQDVRCMVRLHKST